MPPDVLDNGVREDVFVTLLDASGPLSPSTIAAELGIDRELVSYHLKILLNTGLIAREDGGRYFPQPLLTDPDFDKQIDEAISGLFPVAAQKVFADPDADVAAEDAVANALHARITLYLFGDEGDAAASR